MEFGDQIKDLRKKQNLTQEQFAMKLNVNRQAVSNWENNRNLPDLEMLILMADVFHISLDQLILGGNGMNNMTEKLISVACGICFLLLRSNYLLCHRSEMAVYEIEKILMKM